MLFVVLRVIVSDGQVAGFGGLSFDLRLGVKIIEVHKPFKFLANLA